MKFLHNELLALFAGCLVGEALGGKGRGSCRNYISSLSVEVSDLRSSAVG